MTQSPGGALKLADDLTISRMGYGAMQLAGRGVFGPPRDHDQALAVLRAAVELGVTHIDTADFYGPVVTNELIREALHPYADGLHVVTKVGARRGADGSWQSALDSEDLQEQVRENLVHLGLDTLDLVYLRLDARHEKPDDSLSESFGALVALQREGVIRYLGLSGVSAVQLSEAQALAPVVAVQNYYNLIQRQDDELVERCAQEGIAFVPFFPLGGFTPLQSDVLAQVAAQVGASAQQVALAWLLQRSPTMALIPGTASVAHLRENIAAVQLVLPEDALAQLNGLGGQGDSPW